MSGGSHHEEEEEVLLNENTQVIQFQPLKSLLVFMMKETALLMSEKVSKVGGKRLREGKEWKIKQGKRRRRRAKKKIR